MIINKKRDVVAFWKRSNIIKNKNIVPHIIKAEGNI